MADENAAAITGDRTAIKTSLDRDDHDAINTRTRSRASIITSITRIGIAHQNTATAKQRYQNRQTSRSDRPNKTDKQNRQTPSTTL
jgi:ribosomal protein S20